MKFQMLKVLLKIYLSWDQSHLRNQLMKRLKWNGALSMC